MDKPINILKKIRIENLTEDGNSPVLFFMI